MIPEIETITVIRNTGQGIWSIPVDDEYLNISQQLIENVSDYKGLLKFINHQYRLNLPDNIFERLREYYYNSKHDKIIIALPPKIEFWRPS